MLASYRVRRICLRAVLIAGVSCAPGRTRADAPPGVSKIKAVADINQKADASWGPNWCGPTAIANSMLYLSKQYGLGGLTSNNGSPMTDIQLVEAVASAMGVAKGSDGINYVDLVAKKPLYWQPRASLVQKDKVANVTETKLGDKDYRIDKFDNRDVFTFIKDEAAHC